MRQVLWKNIHLRNQNILQFLLPEFAAQLPHSKVVRRQGAFLNCSHVQNFQPPQVFPAAILYHRLDWLCFRGKPILFEDNEHQPVSSLPPFPLRRRHRACPELNGKLRRKAPPIPRLHNNICVHSHLSIFRCQAPCVYVEQFDCSSFRKAHKPRPLCREFPLCVLPVH